MATTAKGIIYPTSSDSIAPLETHFANLANSADLAITNAIPAEVDLQQGSHSSTGPSAVSSWGAAQTVTFGSSFTSVPAVSVSVQTGTNTNAYLVQLIGTPTINGFTYRVYKVAGTASSETLFVNWIANA